MKDVMLAIIAGGAGTRMGGPKHRLQIRGRAILVDLLERMAWEGPTMLVVGNQGERVEGAERVDAVVADAVAGEGPLRGVLTAVDLATTEMVVAVPIDMVRLGGEQVRWVAQHGMELGAACLMLRRTEGGLVRIEPFPGFYMRPIAGMMRARLGAGRRSLMGLTEENGVRVVDAPGEWGSDVWMNVNTLRDATAMDAGVVRLLSET